MTFVKMYRVPNGFRTALVVLGLLAVASGMIHGRADGRWGTDAAVGLNKQLVHNLPKRIGDWLYLEPVELPESAEKMLECDAYSAALYQNVQSGNQVSVILLYGPRGPMAVHTPEVCYPGRGIEQSGKRRELTVQGNGTKHRFWLVNFAQAGQPKTEVAYAWTEGANWVAATQPRFWPVPRLFKLQIAATPGVNDPEEFLKAFVPQWDNGFKS